MRSRAAIFGTENLESIKLIGKDKFELVAFIDDDEFKQGYKIDDIPVISPDEIKNFNVEFIFLNSMSNKDKMYDQLMSLNLQNVCIVFGMDYNPPYFGVSSLINDIPEFNQIRLEMTNLCNYKCFCCPREKMHRPKGIMPINDLQIVLDRIAAEIGDFKEEVHMHGYGEPLLDKDLDKKISLVKKALPNSSPVIVTNLGSKVNPSFLQNIVDAGLKVLNVSFYGYNRETYKLIHGVDGFNIARKNLEVLAKIRKKSSNNFDIVLIMEDFVDNLEGIDHKKHLKDKNNFINWLSSLNINSYNRTRLHNFGLGRNYKMAKEDIPCSIVWGRMSHYLQVSWNLNVIPCCKCFNDDIVFGNLRNQSVKEIFSGKSYKDFISATLNNNLNSYPMCKNCDQDLLGTDVEINGIKNWVISKNNIGTRIYS